MKITKFNGYFVSDESTSNFIFSILSYLSSKHGRHVNISQRDIPDDNVDIACNVNCDLALCEKWFKDENPASKEDVVIGGVYRHFKGKLVKVIAIAQDTENVGAYDVVYESLMDNGVWHRPYAMFVSDVDKTKYPNISQKKRFEFVYKTNANK